MQNFINWFEIPVADMKRSKGFYEGILGVELQEVEVYGATMGMFPNDGSNISGALLCGEGYNPSADGTTVYLNGGDDLQNILSKVEALQGKIIVPKTQISPEFGYFAIFIDCEGNKIGLHSMN